VQSLQAAAVPTDAEPRHDPDHFAQVDGDRRDVEELQAQRRLPQVVDPQAGEPREVPALDRNRAALESAQRESRLATSSYGA
jgi:hypothetical protein